MHVIPTASSNTEGESILGLSHQIETSLDVGHGQILKLRDDILAMHSRHRQASLEGERKLHGSQEREQQLGQAIAGYRQTAVQRERVLNSQITAQRERADALQRDLDNALSQMNHARTEARQQVETASQLEQQLKTEINSQRGMQEALKVNCSQLQSRLTQLQSRGAQLQEAYTKSRAEVELYKTSWAQVIKMERDARAYLQKKDECESRLNEASNRIRDLEALLEKTRKETLNATEAVHSERHAAAEERANAGCALRAAEEERARNHEAQHAAAQARAQTLLAEAQARAVETEATLLRARIAELENRCSTLEAKSPIPKTPVAGIQVPVLGEGFERISASRIQLETERDTLKAQLTQAVREMGTVKEKSELLRRDHLLRELLAHKESDLASAAGELKKISEHAPGRADAEELVETLSEQLEQLRGILHDSELSQTLKPPQLPE